MCFHFVYMQKCTSFEVSNKKKFPTFARTVATDTQVTLSVIQLLRHFNWSTVSLVYSTLEDNLSLAHNLLLRMKMNNINVSHHEEYKANYFRKYLTDDEDDLRLLKIVEKTYKETRSNFLFIYSSPQFSLVSD